MYKKLKKIIYKFLIPLIKIYSRLSFKIYVGNNKEINLVIGAGGTKFENWFSTDIDTLDVTKEEDFEKYFSRKKINKVLAEHVVEHLTLNEINSMLKNIYKYSASNINFRIAVPDGFHTDTEYIQKVKPNGTGEGAFDHKHLFNYKSLSKIAEEQNFDVILVEYWNEDGKFCSIYKNDNKGIIRRSFLNDKRNTDGKPNYTSLIIDLYKKNKN